MEFEVLKKDHKKEIIIGMVILVIIGIALLVKSTFAKYELVKNIKIAEGTINYKVPDFKIMAMYKNDGNGDIATKTMPTSGYDINSEKSYCTLDNINKDTSIKLYTNASGEHIISGLSKSSKCYLYFDKSSGITEILTNNKLIGENADFHKTAQKTCTDRLTCETSNGIYKANDDDGISYFYRGAVENNYVRFAGFYWRIIRINGDRSIRLIYDGTSAHANGTSTTDSIAVANKKFNEVPSINNKYLGFMYTNGQQHGLGTKSNALIELESWYKSNLLSYTTKLDTNAGFCGDRTAYLAEDGTTIGGGVGSKQTYYGAYVRLRYDKSPTLTCPNKSDLYTINSSTKGNKSLTYPIGLLTADEAYMAGALYSTANQSYYLYNGQSYWMMTPFSNPSPLLSNINTDGGILSPRPDYEHGIRPVINLKADTKFTFNGTGEKGTITNPYIVS